MKRHAAQLPRLVAALFAGLLLSGCGPAAMLSMLTPTNGLRVVPGIAYGDHHRQQLDIYAPRVESPTARPVVVFFFGGGWTDGDRADYLFVAEALASRGYLVVIPDYRVYPEVRFPAFVEDGASATAWVLDNVAAFGGDPRQVYVMGHSAGAHIAAMLIFDAGYLRAAGHRPDELAGLIGLAGPYDFLPIESRTLRVIFGPVAQHGSSQPVNFVDGDEPPAYLLHGTADNTVWPRNTWRLAAKIRAASGRVQTRVYEDLDHSRLLGALARPFRNWAPVLEDIAAFIHTNGER